MIGPTPSPTPPPAALVRLAPRVRLADWRTVVLLAVLLYLPWNGQRDLWFPDEPDVAEPAMSMVESGDWVVPRRNGEPWLDYPPLTYWLGAASSSLLRGASPFALRLPVALLAVLVVALTGYATECLAGREAGVWASVSLATAPHFLYQAVSFHPDMAFATLISAGLAAYAWGVERRQGWRSGALRAAGFACFGGAVLAKGILGLLLPGLLLVVWHLTRRQWRALLWMAPLTLVALAVALPWYLALAAKTSTELVGHEVYLQNFARFTDANRGHGEAWHYYLTRIWPDWGPWSLLLPGALVTAWRRDWDAPLPRLALLSFVVSLLFFSLAATKREVYLLPVYPAIAFLVGRHAALAAERPGRTGYRWVRVGLGAAALLAGGVALAAALLDLPSALPATGRAAAALDGSLAAPLIVLGVALAAGGLVLLLGARDGLTPSLVTRGTAVLFVVYLVALSSLAPRMDEAKSYREAAVWLRRQAGPHPIGFYLPGAHRKYAGIRVNDPAYLLLELLATPRDAALYLRRPESVLLLRTDRSEEVARLSPEWVELPKHPLSLSGTAFLAVGPRPGTPPS
ncbi:MAG: glycosyltransferase family 39 protein [Thermoanaerobaculia bacterium]|nr:glycosyltransferase family 39 protein [Thermoanaerobaculia bacterium]